MASKTTEVCKFRGRRYNIHEEKINEWPDWCRPWKDMVMSGVDSTTFVISERSFRLSRREKNRKKTLRILTDSTTLS
jgi:hypothetical protein